MADTQAVSRFTPAWMLFLNSTTAGTARWVTPSTIADPSPPSSPPLSVRTSTSSSTSFPLTGSTSASRPFDPSGSDLAIPTSLPISLPEADIGVPSRLSTPFPLTVDSVADLPLTSPLISSLDSTTSDIPSLPILLSTPPLSPTDSPPSSASKQTFPNTPSPTRASVSQIGSPPPSPGVPTGKPEDPSPPAPTSHEEHSALPVPMITAIVVSVVVFLLLLVILLSQLRHRRQRRRGPLPIDGAVDQPGSVVGRSYSLVAAYQSAHRGVVHVVVDKGARNGPGSDGIPLHHHERLNRMSGASQRGSGTGVRRWSLGSLGGSDTSVGAGGYSISADDYAGVGRAY